MVALQKFILIVEDHTDTLDAMAILLKELGYQVVTANTREQALNLVSAKRPDLIIFDFLMPGMSLEEFLKLARRSSADAQFIICSGIANLESGARAYGIKRWVRKPFQNNDLEVAVRDILGDCGDSKT